MLSQFRVIDGLQLEVALAAVRNALLEVIVVDVGLRLTFGSASPKTTFSFCVWVVSGTTVNTFLLVCSIIFDEVLFIALLHACSV